MTTATSRWAVLLMLVFASPVVLAQELGDEFIFFVDGTNILVPDNPAETVNDPLAPTSGEKVAKFAAGGWSHNGFAWARSEGVDATASVGDTFAESDTLYFRILSDPANAGGANVDLWLTDKTNDVSGNRSDLEAEVDAGTLSADFEFRLIWDIPEYVHDGEWHEFAIPLPPATQAALEAAKAAADNGDGTFDETKIDTLAAKWRYAGSWTGGGSEGGYGIGPDWTSADDKLFSEFEWGSLYKFGPSWDNADGGAPIYMDNVYIGGPNTSTASASDPPTAMSGVMGAADGTANTLSWSEVSGASGYKVYASLFPIADVTAQGVVELARIRFDEDFSYTHNYEAPFEGVGADGIYYAVTTLSGFGVENLDISSSTVEVDNESLPVQAYVKRLTSDEADAMFDAVSNGNATDGFADGHPVFVINSERRTVTEGPSGDDAPTDDDISAEIKVGYDADNFMYFYGEITDDVTGFAGEGIDGGNTWNYDSIEIGYGSYEVTAVAGGGLLEGSPHDGFETGANPDYQFRFAGRVKADGSFGAPSTFVSGGQMEFGGTTVVETTDTGWRFLTVAPLENIQADGDSFLEPPGEDGLQFLPFIIALNDADATGTRESQIVSSIKGNVNNQWWNTPSQWETVAFAGSNAVFVANEDDLQVEGFGLAQSAPNPAAGRASITFALGAPRTATLEVFNTLGQRVALVADGEYPAGEHTITFDTRSLAAGVYVYRLSAGDYAATRRMTVVR